MTRPTQPGLFDEGAPPTTGLFAEVVFNRPLDHAFTYAIPDDLRAHLAIGKRVLVPFGKGDKATAGYCVGVTDLPPGREVKELLQVLDDESLLTPNLLRLTRWMADYYLCSWGQVLNAVVPAGAKQQAGTRATILLEAVPLDQCPHPPPTLTAKQTAVLEVLRQQAKPIEPPALAKLAKCGSGPIHVLVEKGLAQRNIRRLERFRPDEEPRPELAIAPTLTPEQQAAWKELEPALAAGGFQTFLLHGVTGSGKTELYLRAIEQVIRQGKEALVLVPEISLTPQTIQSFRSRCSDVAVLHSHLPGPERGGYWRRIAGGHVQVVVGARSAVFAPTRRLGLIVIDEEHESTFKQESTPRYHARDVAVMRARLENIPILLGSATPSLESWHNAQRGQYKLLTLPNRVFNRPMPEVHLVDLRHDRLPFAASALSRTLETAMRQTLGDGGQVILLLNRRGFSPHVHCPTCGYVESCKFCDLSLTYHRQRDVLLCHFCGYQQAPTDKCPKCNQAQIRFLGFGTEKLQAEIETRFAGHTVRRMDSDTMDRPGSHKKVLEAFRNGEIQILLGTQMIAKGLDFPNVTLVGVVNADVGLHRPDFRAAERTFQLLAQVAGRTGRGERGGKVFVQTFNPEHPSIALAAAHNYLGFVEIELPHRKFMHYPPFLRMARIILRAREQQAGADFADRLAEGFRTFLARPQKEGEEPWHIRLLGPAECPVFRLKNYFRYHFQLQSARSGQLHQVLRSVMQSVPPMRGVELTVDVDPQDMM